MEGRSLRTRPPKSSGITRAARTRASSRASSTSGYPSARRATWKYLDPSKRLTSSRLSGVRLRSQTASGTLSTSRVRT